MLHHEEARVSVWHSLEIFTLLYRHRNVGRLLEKNLAGKRSGHDPRDVSAKTCVIIILPSTKLFGKLFIKVREVQIRKEICHDRAQISSGRDSSFTGLFLTWRFLVDGLFYTMHSSRQDVARTEFFPEDIEEVRYSAPETADAPDQQPAASTQEYSPYQLFPESE